MRHNLIVCYFVSLSILGIILFLTVLSGSVRNSLFYSGPMDITNFTPAFSENLNRAYLLNLFSDPKPVLVTLLSLGLLLQIVFLYTLLASKKMSSGGQHSYFIYWAVLFIPYLLLLIFII